MVGEVCLRLLFFVSNEMLGGMSRKVTQRQLSLSPKLK